MSTIGILLLWGAILAFWVVISGVIIRDRARRRDANRVHPEAGFVP
ncbi:MAG: hypothetical protein ACRELV_03520 [Longimicrobiales bacterium]